jgi:hypothetical protein
MVSEWMPPPVGTIDEKVIQTRRPNGAIEDVVVYEVEKPKGNVRVELRDERGHVTHQEAKDNFISRVWAYCVRTQQRYSFSAYPYNFVVGANAYDMPVPQVAGRHMFHYPNNWLAAWNDTSAEDSANEHRVKTDGQGIVAYACRLPFAAPANKRGQINSTESAWSNAGESMVYDWPTNAGNGTLQSIGYTAMRTGGLTSGIPFVRPSFIDRRYAYFTGGNPIGGTAGAWYPPANPAGFASANARAVPALDASNNLLILTGYYGSGAYKPYIIIIPATTWRDGHASKDMWGASAIAINPAAPLVTSGLTYYNSDVGMLGESGGFYWITNAISSSYSQIWRINKSTGAGDQATFIGPGSTGAQSFGSCGCIIGGKIYVIPYQTNNPSMYRHNVAAPPAYEATIAISWPSVWASGFVQSCTTDGTDLFIYHVNGGWARFGTDGSLKEHIGAMGGASSSFPTEVSNAPYQGTYSQRTLSALPLIEEVAITRYASPGGVDATSLDYRGQQVTLQYPYANSVFTTFGQYGFVYGGELWMVGNINGFGVLDQTLTLFYAISKDAGWNLGSRVLLGAPVVKDATKTMKITYGITLPGFLS